MNIPTPRLALSGPQPYTSICISCQRERPVNLIGECINCCKSAVEFFDSLMVRYERRVAAIQRAHRLRLTLVAVLATAPLWVPVLVLLWRNWK